MIVPESEDGICNVEIMDNRLTTENKVAVIGLKGEMCA